MPAQAAHGSWWTASVSRRIGFMLVVVAAFTVVAALVSLRGLHTLNGQLRATIERKEHAEQLVTQMLKESERLSNSARQAATAATPEERTAALTELEAAKKALGEHIDQISAQIGDAPELQKALQEGFSSFVISAVKSSRLLQAGRQEAAEKELLMGFDPKLLSYVLMTISGVSQHTGQSMRTLADSGHNKYTHTLRLLLAAVSIAIAAALGSMWLLHRTVLTPVRRMARAAEQLASGDFDMDLAVERQDECGEMLQATAQASRRMADSISTIHEIAFKTNILALNAAVEAARAGEHGRSFAVVAAEVRALASKSASAAREIETLIADSHRTVEEGTRRVGDAGVVIRNIVQQVQSAAVQMSQISTAGAQQSRCANDVTTAVGSIDTLARQTAQMVAQAAQSAEQLRDQAQALRTSMAQFTGTHMHGDPAEPLTLVQPEGSRAAA